MNKTTTLHVHHAFLYISLPSLQNYDVKWSNFKFTSEQERQGNKILASLSELGRGPLSSTQTKIPFF